MVSINIKPYIHILYQEILETRIDPITVTEVDFLFGIFVS